MSGIKVATTKATAKITVFTDKFPFIGPIVWVLSVQHFAAQLVAAHAWSSAYSWSQNLISDLGNTACGQYADRFVCSPQHGLMNASFIMLGVTMALGSWLIYTEFRRSRATLIGFSLMGLAGLGTLLVGMFPENTVIWLHGMGAFLALGVGNVSLVVLALGIRQARDGFRFYTFVSGVLSLVALGLFMLGIDFGLGAGTIERLVSYPQTLWLILFGLYMTGTRARARLI